MGSLKEIFTQISAQGGGAKLGPELAPGAPGLSWPVCVSVYICVSLGVSPLHCARAGSRCVPAAQQRVFLHSREIPGADPASAAVRQYFLGRKPALGAKNQTVSTPGVGRQE